MQKHALAVAAILSFGCTVGSYAADVKPLDDMLKAEEAEHLPTFGPPRGKLTPTTAEALAQELRDDRFVAQGFSPVRLVFPNGAKEPVRYVIVRALKVQPLTGEQVLKSYAKDVPVDPDALKTAPAVEDAPLVKPELLFNQRRMKEWSK
jgi:hypothetical protein